MRAVRPPRPWAIKRMLLPAPSECGSGELDLRVRDLAAVTAAKPRTRGRYGANPEDAPARHGNRPMATVTSPMRTWGPRSVQSPSFLRVARQPDRACPEGTAGPEPDVTLR